VAKVGHKKICIYFTTFKKNQVFNINHSPKNYLEYLFHNFDLENIIDRKDINVSLFKEITMKDKTHLIRTWNKWQ